MTLQIIAEELLLQPIHFLHQLTPRGAQALAHVQQPIALMQRGRGPVAVLLALATILLLLPSIVRIVLRLMRSDDHLLRLGCTVGAQNSYE